MEDATALGVATAPSSSADSGVLEEDGSTTVAGAGEEDASADGVVDGSGVLLLDSLTVDVGVSLTVGSGKGNGTCTSTLPEKPKKSKKARTEQCALPKVQENGGRG